MFKPVSIEKQLLLNDYPSGSSIEFHNNHLYLIGDDANRILVLDPEYNLVDSITLFNAKGRIAKPEKADFESSTIISSYGIDKLVIFGSASLAPREKLIEVSVGSKEPFKEIEIKKFIARLDKAGIEQINIEGAGMVKDTLVLVNRANGSNPQNQFISTTPDFYNNQDSAPFFISTISLPDQAYVPGISGLMYVKEKDILVFTASSEETNDTYSDGKIGDSYIGWINDASLKMKTGNFNCDGFINLSAADERFIGEKIESLCLEKYKENNLLIHLASDNDNGETMLFKVRLKLPG